MMPEFEAEKRGYNKQQVDEYIDILRGEYDKIAGLCKEYYARIEALEAKEASQEDIARALLAAQSFASKLEKDAKIKAEQIINEAKVTEGAAKKKETQILANAQRKADQIIADAQTKASQATTLANTRVE